MILCVYYMTGTPEGSTESSFMEKPGIEPATPGLQGIALIHYTTGASQTDGQTDPHSKYSAHLWVVKSYKNWKPYQPHHSLYLIA